jgi:hypothetical protein
MVKGFGRRQAYESLSCRNPRAYYGVYGDFEFAEVFGDGVMTPQRPERRVMQGRACG